jgi:(1->4)-alpha-D-glucan 1-alpha-D-glucosylmutase
VIACFPVYRTYISERGHSEQDERTIAWAVTVARKRSLAADVSVFDFLREMLLVSPVRDVPASRRVAMREFAMKFQQVTAPVAAKGVEDTALYRYNRLVCLNEVGSDPRRFGVSAQAVHQENAERMRRWPLCMLATSTHDTKRSEDVRANIAVLSELPDQWRRHLARWSRLNRSKRRLVNDAAAPDREDEYLIYQTLMGLWVSGTAVTATANELSQRLQEYIVKAAREAKRSTSWLNPDEQYEVALRSFVASLLHSPGRNAFLHDFEKLASTLSWFGFLNSLAQVVLKIASPGVADIYQGSESPVFALVDPDNRRSVDFEAARQRLASLEQRIKQESGTLQQGMNRAPRAQLLRDFVTAGHAGEGKLYVTYLMLKLRREHPQLFSRGSYEPLTVGGERKEHVLAFARVWERQRIVVIIARWACKLLGGMRPASSDGSGANGPEGNDIWGNAWAQTHVELDKAWPVEPLTDLFSARTIRIQMDPPCIAVA